MRIRPLFAILLKLCMGGACFLILVNAINAQPGNDLRKSKANLRFEQARDSLAKALAGQDSMKMAECYYILGKSYIGLENFIQARHNLLRSIAIRERYGPSEEIARAYMRLTECELYEKDKINFDNATRYLRQVLYNSQRAKSHFGLMNAYRGMASIHVLGAKMRKMGIELPFSPSIDSILYYQNSALKIAIALRKPIDIALGYDLLADTWSYLGNYKQGILYEKQAISLYKKLGRVEANIEPYMQLGIRYLEMRQYKLAKHWLDRSKSLSDSCNWRTYTYASALAHSYSAYFMAAGDSGKAMSYQKEEYEQKLKGEESYRKAAVDGITVSLENDRKGYQLALQEKELENRREKARLQSWLIFSSVLLFVLACVVAVLSHRLYKRYKAKSHKNEHLFLEQSHRIKNNLQTISDLLQLQLGDLNEPKAIQVIAESVLRVEAMSFIHKRLYGKNRSIEIEISEYVRDLVNSVLRSYHASDVMVDYQIEKILLHADKAIPLGLIINELVNNACKHALAAQPKPRLSVGCYEVGDDIFLYFEDNGPGFEAQNAKDSFGLELIRIWVANLKGESSFTFGAGTRFTLFFKKRMKMGRNYESEFMR